MVIDKILFNYLFNKKDSMQMSDSFKELIHTNPSDKANIIDEQLYFDITKWLLKHFHDNAPDIWDKFTELVTFNPHEYVNIVKDVISEYMHTYDWIDHITSNDNIAILDEYAYKSDTVEMEDVVYFEPYWIPVEGVE